MTKIGLGLVRSCVAAAVLLLVPAVWAAAVVLAFWWGSWAVIAPAVWAAIGTLLLARPVCRLTRTLAARWTGTGIPGGYREAQPVTQMATGYWWNGCSYSPTAERAREEQRWRLRVTDPALRRDLRFIAVAVVPGLIAAVPLAALAAAITALTVLRGGSASVAVAIAGLLLAVAAAPFAWRPLTPFATRFLRPSPAMRVEELTVQHADSTVAQAAEIRRIERDLHDGAQARLVALGLSLATMERLMETDPAKAKAVLREARAGAATSLNELRELVRGISPPVLNERGLVDAVKAFALDSPLEATVDAEPQPRLDPPIEAALYFGVAELVTNAAKHAAASRATITITRAAAHLTVDVADDGRGGATVNPGGGLAGLRRRLAAFNGTLELTSPSGGPTHARMAVPCEF